MAYESIAAYLDKIEILLSEDFSPHAIANELGISKQWRTIHRYKKEVFDFKKAASEDWTAEKQKSHEERFKAGKERIIDNYELLNRLKIKADSLLDFRVGDEFQGPEGSEYITPATVSKIYADSAKITAAAIKTEQELAGDDPESRKADALVELSDAQLREIIEATSTATAEESE